MATIPQVEYITSGRTLSARYTVGAATISVRDELKR